MKTEQRIYADHHWSDFGSLSDAQLVLIPTSTSMLHDDDWLVELRRRYPSATLIGCSTAGEIAGTRVLDDTVVATAVRFDATPLKFAQLDCNDADSSEKLGRQLIEKLPSDGLAHVFVLSDGQHVNGSELVRGMRSALPAGVQATGGLAGDGDRFEHTFVLHDGQPRERTVTAVGFYGDVLRVGYGSMGGWDPFGPRRQVTRSKGNILYELDGKPALQLYKKYLGEHAVDLPAAGLLFPLCVRLPDSQRVVVRTILNVDEQHQSLTFAGDLPQGSIAQLMKANFERLIDGASSAAHSCIERLDGDEPAELAVLISCVGRKLVLKQRTEEELEAVQEVLGARATFAGFYSYGEICPTAMGATCELHNQTMTITTFREVTS